MSGALSEPWTPFTRAEVIKCDPGRDFYVARSHIVEAPTWCGTWSQAFMAGCDMDRLDRADLNGSSFHLLDQFGCRQRGLWWDAGGLIAEQLGYLPRARLAAYVRAYCRDRLGVAYAMLERFEDLTREQHLARIKATLRDRDRARRPRRHKRCRECRNPWYNRKPLAVDGHEYRRRQRARRRRKR